MKKLVLVWLVLLAPVLADQGMTSPTHSAHAGEIVFSNEPILFRKEDPSKLRQSFKLGEPIYGRLYFQKSMANTALHSQQTGNAEPPGSGRDGSWELLVYVDGVNQNIRFGNFAQGRVSQKAEREWTSWQLNLQPEDEGDKVVTDPWVKVAAGMKPGRHQVKLVYRATLGDYKATMAEGEFTLEVADGASFSAGTFPESSYRGSDLEQIKQAMKSALVGPVTKNPHEILDVSVTSEFRPGRYTDTLVEYRKIQGTVLWADKGDGVCRYTSYSFIQDRQGTGWSTLRFKAFVNGGPEGNVKR